MCNDKTDLNITCTSLFLDNISIFYQAFGMNLPFSHITHVLADVVSLLQERWVHLSGTVLYMFYSKHHDI